MITTAVSLKDLLLEAIKNGNHTLRDFGKLDIFNPFSTGEIVQELEVLENIYVFKVLPPAAPFLSWWLKKPKGKIIYNEKGKLIELQPEEKPAIEIPIEITVVEKETKLESAGDYVEIPVNKIFPNPKNPRGAVNTTEQKFLDLVESIKEQGIQQPLVVTRQGIRYRIVIGHRRFEAAKTVGLKTVPCILQEYSPDAEESVMLIENIQRKDLTPIQEAKAFKRLYLKLEKDINAVARQIGLTQNYIKQRINLLKLHDDIQQMVEERKIGFSQALQLTRIELPKQKKFVNRAVTMSANSFKLFIDREKNGFNETNRSKPISLRVTTDNEHFNRASALKALDKAGDTFYPARYLRDAFADVCQDICDDKTCLECPAPRLIEAMLRHKERGENNGK